MTIDKYGVLRFFEGGDADSAAANDAAAAASIGDDGIGADATDASLGQAGVENAMDALGLAALGSPEAAVTPGGMTYGDLEALAEMGFGQMTGVNPNNPTQSVEEALAAQDVHGFANVAVPALMGFAVPGFNTITAAAQALGNLTSGQTSFGQTVANVAIGIVANQLGITPGMVTEALNGNVGGITGQAAVSAINSAIASLTGLPVGAVNLGMNITGAGQGLASNISGAVNEGLGITPTNNVASIGQQIDAALGLTPGQGLGGPASGQSSSPSFDATGNYGFGGDAPAANAVTPSGSLGSSAANAVTPSGSSGSSEPTASAATAGSTLPALMAALAAAGYKEEEPEPYQVAQIDARSPFGTGPYASTGKYT